MIFKSKPIAALDPAVNQNIDINNQTQNKFVYV